MLSYYRLIPIAFRLASLVLCVANLATGATLSSNARNNKAVFEGDKSASAKPSDPEGVAIVYKWNVQQKDLPLLGLTEDHLKPGLGQSLSYPMDPFSFAIFQSLTYDDERGRYVLPSFSREGKAGHFIEFESTESKNSYKSTDGTNIQLVDRDSLKTIRTSNGTKYIFVRYPDGEFRCASIKESNGADLSMLYTANGLMLHGVVDSSGRTITFNYASDGLKSVTQTWMANSEGLTKSWVVDDRPTSPQKIPVKYSHAAGFIAAKALPMNAVVRRYTPEMAASDKMLAHIFGGPDAVAGANGFEPAGLAASYPLYRGDVMGDDGRERRGHLSFAMHLYGSPDGTGDSPLYVPTGFVLRSGQPSPTDAVVTFYYPRLGSLTDVTLAVFHVADFQISYEGGRVRIGNIGGHGGSSAFYKHSHIEFYRGNTGLPPLQARARLRIDPVTVFTSASDGR